MTEEKKTITIGNQDITFSGLVFSKYFGILFVLTLIFVLSASIKYLFS